MFCRLTALARIQPLASWAIDSQRIQAQEIIVKYTMALHTLGHLNLTKTFPRCSQNLECVLLRMTYRTAVWKLVSFFQVCLILTLCAALWVSYEDTLPNDHITGQGQGRAGALWKWRGFSSYLLGGKICGLLLSLFNFILGLSLIFLCFRYGIESYEFKTRENQYQG